MSHDAIAATVGSNAKKTDDNNLNKRNMDFSDNTTQIILAVIAAIAATGIIIKFVVNKNKTKSSGSVNIKDSNIGGDVAGRDIKK